MSIQLRGDTAAAWKTANPVLADREPAYERDTGRLKVGNGVTTWNALPYVGTVALDEHNLSGHNGVASLIDVVSPGWGQGQALKFAGVEIAGTNGRNRFVDSAKSDGNGLIVGEVSGMYGLNSTSTVLGLQGNGGINFIGIGTLSSSGGGLPGQLAVGAGSTTNHFEVNVGGQPARTAMVIKSAASMTANLLEWQTSGGVAYGTISENGYLTTRKTTAPADAELAAGEMAWWFDSTNGAAKAMFKGKSANGTVVSGSVALA